MFIANPRHVSGIQSHAEDILKGLQEIDKLKYCCLYVTSDCHDYFLVKYPEAEVPLIDTYSRIFRKYLMKTYQKITGRSGSNTIKKLEESVYSKESRRCDILLHTYNNNLGIDMTPGVKNIWVFHDFFAQRMKIHDKKRALIVYRKYSERLKISDAIVTISHFVENDMYRFFPDITVSNPHVIPNSVGVRIDTSAADIASRTSMITGPYILNINAIVKYKNHITLIKAFQKIMNNIPHSLILVGKPCEVFPELSQYIQDNNLSKRVKFFSHISEEEKLSLYANASLFVTPSMHEGFGRTPIEAAMFKIPVISTRCDSLPEVTLELLNYYDPPCDVNNLANMMLEVLAKEPDMEKLTKIAETYKKKYSCRTIAEQYWNLIEKVYDQ